MNFKVSHLMLWAGALSMAAAANAWAQKPASVEGPGQLPAGAVIEVKWTGPSDKYDRIGVVPVGTPEGQATNFSFPTQVRNPVRFDTPDEPGDYEITPRASSKPSPKRSSRPSRSWTARAKSLQRGSPAASR